MARLTPCSRTDFIRKLRRLGYEGPSIYVGSGESQHPNTNPHAGDISVDLLSHILRDANVDRDAWISA